MRKLLLACLATTLFLYLWGGIFWMTPLPYKALEKAPSDSSAGTALLEQFPASGTYMIPGRDGTPEQLADLREAGPVGMVHLERKGRPTLSGLLYLPGFLHLGLSALLIVALVRLVRASLQSRSSQCALAAVTGLALAIFADGTQPIWFLHPPLWNAVLGLYHATAWFLGALVAMAFVLEVPSPFSRFLAYPQSSAAPSG